MSRTQKFLALFLSLCFTPTLLSGCAKSEKTLVVYTSVDQVFSEQIFSLFEQETGIKIQPVYDIEASKTVGLVNRLISEKGSPQADVFWNGEILQTIVLKENDVLEKADIIGAEDLPSGFVDPDGLWYGFGGRARVLIVNKSLAALDDCPKTMADLAGSKYSPSTGMAYPVFGTTSTHAAVLYAALGADAAKAYFEKLKAAGISIVEGNSVVKDFVSQKKLAMGMTDTDDALGEMAANPDLDVIFLDQGENGMGTLVIPNTVVKIKGAKHSKEADTFMNFLLSAKTEQKLVDLGWIQLPVHEGITPAPQIEGRNIKIMQADFNAAYALLEQSKTDLTNIFVQ